MALGVGRMGAMAKLGAEEVFKTLGSFGGKETTTAGIRALGKRRAMIGGAGLVGLNVMNRMRTTGMSSGANGAPPSRSMGGDTGY